MKKGLLLLISLNIICFLNAQEINSPIIDTLINENSRVFLFGGATCVDASNVLNNIIVKEFNSKGKSFLIINELPASYTFFINKYLKSKDKSILSFIFNNKNSPLYKHCKNPLEDFILHDTILHLGIDYEYNDWITYTALKEMSYNINPPVELEENFQNLNNILKNPKLPSRLKSLKFANDFVESIEKNESLYEELLGIDFFEFKRIINGLYFGMKYPVKVFGRKNIKNREQWLYHNLNAIATEFKEFLILGFVDQTHLCKEFQSNWMGIRNWSSLANKLNMDEKSIVKGNVVSVIYYFKLTPVSKDDFYNKGILDSKMRAEIFQDNQEKYSIFNICESKSKYNAYCNVFDYVIIDRKWPLK